MAVVAEKKDQDNQNPQASGPITGAGGSTGQQGGGRLASYSSGAQPTSKGSGRFTNLKSYVEANTGAGQQLGSRIGAGLEKNVNKAADTSQAQAIGNQVQAEKERLGQGEQFANQVKTETGAQDIAGNEQQKQQFSNLLNNQNVASNLQNQAQTQQAQQQAALQQAGQNVNQLGTESGRFGLLQKTVKNPTYTSGQQRLDQLFLQAGSPQDLAQKQRNLTRQVSQAGLASEDMYKQLGTDIGAAGKQAQDVSNLLSSTLSGETTNLSEAQRQEAEALNQANVNRNTALNTFFTSGYSNIQDPEQRAFIDEALKSGNLNAGDRTYNVLKEPNSYKKYMNEGGTGYQGQDVVDANELARYNALYTLGGGTGDKLYNNVGSGGVQSGLKGQELYSDIDKAKEDVLNRLNSNSSLTTDEAMRGTWNDLRRVKVDSNYSDLLKHYLDTNSNSGLDQYITDNSKNMKMVDMYISKYGDPNNPYAHGNTPEMRDEFLRGEVPEANEFLTRARIDQVDRVTTGLRQQMIQEFLDRINSEGVNQGLGGVAPGSIPNAASKGYVP